MQLMMLPSWEPGTFMVMDMKRGFGRGEGGQESCQKMIISESGDTFWNLLRNVVVIYRYREGSTSLWTQVRVPASAH